MNKSIFEIQGFEQLKAKIKSLPDKVKAKEIVKILRRSAKSTIDAARSMAPISKKAHVFRGGKVFQPGNLRKSIRAASMRRSRVPMIIVGPRSSGKYDGFYGRAFVIPGHKTTSGFVAANDFMARAFRSTGGLVADSAVAATEKYIQKQIDRL